MNVFDESDSEEEKSDLKRPLSALFGADDKDEDEDPLDAYMKSLDSTTTTNSSSNNVSQSSTRAVRLDVENEEEATSHWELDRSEEKACDSVEADDEAQAAASRSVLTNTFHKAGSSFKPDQIKLEKVEHSSVHYEDFRMVFWEPKDTTWGHRWRSDHLVTCNPGTMDPISTFAQLSEVLGPDLIATMNKKGYITPTTVQAQTLPVALAGRDAIVTASTGSGKTLSYIWPMVVHVCDQRTLDPGEGPIGIVLVPTRELALQVEKNAQIMLQPLRGKSIAITGGVNNYHLVQNFSKHGCEIVVATPGRLLDVLSIKKNGISLRRVTMVVLDEFDKMLDMGFESQVAEILNTVRPDRQSLLLSATLGRKIERITGKWLRNPVRISIGRTGQASHHVKQHVIVLPSSQAKKAWIKEMVPVLADVGRTIIFVATRVDSEAIAEAIRMANRALIIDTLHGDKHASDRQKALKAFSKGQLSALVATDVASRGLDIANVSTVVNFDPAKNLDIHSHRVGRAGRLSKKDQKHVEGSAYTLLTTKNADFAHVLMASFERDGHDIGDDLRNLAAKSRKSGNVASRDKWNKTGLGFDENESLPEKDQGYYGPTKSDHLSSPKPPKRSRWG